jgi:two-component sensor histidine kinase
MTTAVQPSGLVDFLLQLSFARTLGDIGSVLRKRLRRIVGADGIALILRDEDRCHYFDEDAVGPLWKGQKFPMSNCVSGWAMLNREVVIIENIYADPRVPHEAYRPTFVKSLAMVPIRPEAPLGAIGAYWAKHRRASADEIALMQTIVNATALAIENAKLFSELEQRKREAEAQAEYRQALLQKAQAALAERNVLLREVHHRVKNNFQTIVSLLRLQLRYGKHPEESVQRGIARIHAMGLVHQCLYEATDLARVDLANLLRRLVADIAARDGGKNIRVATHGDGVALDLDRSASVALLAHEALENCCKHAFPDGADGSISVELREADGNVSLVIADDGCGFDPATTTKGMGLWLIATLAGQLKASVVHESSGGTRLRLTLAKTPPVPASTARH